VDTNLRRADLRAADLHGAVMLRGSLENARLETANLLGTRLVDVPIKGARCTYGTEHLFSCAALDVSSGEQRRHALARVDWLRSLPWPWD
jgi:hypothetical protein